jgi:hypothetical protein
VADIGKAIKASDKANQGAARQIIDSLEVRPDWRVAAPPKRKLVRV